MKKLLLFLCIFYFGVNLWSQNINMFKEKKEEKKEKEIIEIVVPDENVLDLVSKATDLKNLQEDIEKYRESVEIKHIRPKIMAAKATPDSTEGPSFVLPLGVNAKTAKESNSAGPLIGLQLFSEGSFISAFFNYAGDRQAIGKKQIGPLMLNPTSDSLGAYFSGSINISSITTNDSLFWGISGRMGCTSTNWKIDDDSTDPGVSGFIVYIDPSVQIITKPIRLLNDNEAGLCFEAGPMFRFIVGDLVQSTNDSFRTSPEILGTSKKSYIGLGMTLALKINSIKPFVRFTIFSAKGIDITGFTGPQITLGAEILTTFIQSKL
jgi:hypothetical protein